MTDNHAAAAAAAAAERVVANPEDATEAGMAEATEPTTKRTPSRRNMPQRASKSKLSPTVHALVAERDGSDVANDDNNDDSNDNNDDNNDDDEAFVEINESTNDNAKTLKKKRQRNSISKTKTKLKRKQNANAAVRQFDNNNNNNNDDDDDRDHPKTRQEFERHRAEILSLLPDDFKSMFGQVGFGKYARGYNPALILHPFDLVPPQVRTRWIDTVRKVSRKSGWQAGRLAGRQTSRLS